MPRVDIVVECDIEKSARVRQISAMFDCPLESRQRLEWSVHLPIEELDWNVGLIVGPSGSGKTTIARHLFGNSLDVPLSWSSNRSVVDDFSKSLSLADISSACASVGFNTIPAWLRPYHVLSNGEKFRIEIARRVLELPDPIVVDEFTSVVDRQVAQVASHAVQKFIRKARRKFVAVSCHSDIIDWLQPDWIFNVAEQSFERRLLRRRPTIEVVIDKVSRDAWRLFAPFHYMSAKLPANVKTYGAWVKEQLVSFVAVIPKMVRAHKLYGVSRIVTLPDFQGVGVASILVDTVASAYRALGRRFRHYPAHPPYIRQLDRAENWALVGTPKSNVSSKVFAGGGGRPCASFEFIGAAMSDVEAARRLVL